MEKILIYKKGYLLKIDSWENDADLNQTIEYQTEDKELAFALKDMLIELFGRRYSGVRNAGNSMDDEKIGMVLDYFKNDNVLSKLFADKEGDNKRYSIHDFITEMIGYSEFYDFRVVDKVDLFEVKEDFYLKKL